MKTKKFEYVLKDVPMLKRDMFLRLIYFFLFVAVCVLQVVTIIMFANQFTTLHYIISCSVCVMSLMLALISMWYATSDVASINMIKRNGHHVKNSPMMFASSESFLFKMFNFMSKVLAVIMIAVALSAITYNILQYIYYQTISIFIPT
ncbi:MAG: hypothetical protein MJ152_04125, partial [Clostridia bacterium]|nr:hypothetical protein [Clostridia bacterium]